MKSAYVVYLVNPESNGLVRVRLFASHEAAVECYLAFEKLFPHRDVEGQKKWILEQEICDKFNAGQHIPDLTLPFFTEGG